MENGDESSVENMEPEPEDDLPRLSLLDGHSFSSNDDTAEDGRPSKSSCSDANEARSFTPASDQLILSSDEETQGSTLLDDSLVEGGAALKHALESMSSNCQATQDLQLSSDSSLSDLDSSNATNNDEHNSEEIDRIKCTDRIDDVNERSNTPTVLNAESKHVNKTGNVNADESSSQDSYLNGAETGAFSVCEDAGQKDSEDTRKLPMFSEGGDNTNIDMADAKPQMVDAFVHSPVEDLGATSQEAEDQLSQDRTSSPDRPKSISLRSPTSSPRPCSTSPTLSTEPKISEEDLAIGTSHFPLNEGSHQTCDSETVGSENDTNLSRTGADLRGLDESSGSGIRCVDGSEIMNDNSVSDFKPFVSEHNSFPTSAVLENRLNEFESQVHSEGELAVSTEDKVSLSVSDGINSFSGSNHAIAERVSEEGAAEKGNLASALLEDDGSGDEVMSLDSCGNKEAANDEDEGDELEMDNYDGECEDAASEEENHDNQSSSGLARVNGTLSESMDCDIYDGSKDDSKEVLSNTPVKSEKPMIMSQNLNLAWKKAFANTARRYEEGNIEKSVSSIVESSLASDSSCIVSPSENSCSAQSVGPTEEDVRSLSEDQSAHFTVPTETEQYPASKEFALTSKSSGTKSKFRSFGMRRKRIRKEKKTSTSTQEDLSSAPLVAPSLSQVMANPALDLNQFGTAQPNVLYKCVRCGLKGFTSMRDLRDHQLLCLRNPAIPLPREQNASTSPENNNRVRITRKVFLCSACGTYYENWNLFLHMREVHKRHICLFCLGMFSQAEKLSLHLVSKHKVSGGHYASPEDFKKSFKGLCYLMCCSCERMFTEENFTSHICRRDLVVCNVCQGRGFHLPNCQVTCSPRDCATEAPKTSSSWSPQKVSEASRISEKEKSRSTTSRTHVNFKYNRLGSKSKGILKVKIPTVPPKRREEQLVPEFNRSTTPASPSASHLQSSQPVSVQSQPASIPGNFASNLDKTINAVALGATEEARAWEERMEAERRRIQEARLIYTDTEDENDSGTGDAGGGTDELGHSSSSCQSEEEDNSNEIAEGERREELKLEKEDEENQEQHQELSQQEDNWQHSREECQESREDWQQSREDWEQSREGWEQSREGWEQARDEWQQPSKEVPTEQVSETEDETRAEKSDEGLKETAGDEQLDEGEEERMKEPFNTSLDEHLDSENVEPVEKSLELDSDIGKMCEIMDTMVASTELHPPSPEPMDVELNPPNESLIHHPDPASSPVVSHVDENLVTEPAVERNCVAEQSAPVAEKVPTEDTEPLRESVVEESHTPLAEEDNTEPKTSDGITLAGEEVSETELTLDKPLHIMKTQEVLKECVRYLCWSCVYCSHAKKIAVNGKQLALHMLSEHRVVPVDDAHHDTPAGKRLIAKLKDSLEFLQLAYFNTDSYDSTDKANSLPYDRSYECFHCHFYTRLHKELYVHNRKMHQKTILLCIMCKSNFYSYSELLSHLCPGIYIPQINITFRCCMCDVDELPSAFRLMVHLRKKHNACDVCLEVTDDQQKLSNHVWKHKLHHLCYRCGIAYRNKPDITKHLFWKHGTESVLCKKCLQKKWPHVYHFCVPPPAFICEECSAMFTRAVALRVHKRFHAEDFRYPCTECEDKFVSKKLLAKHLEKHRTPSIPIPQPQPTTVPAPEVKKVASPVPEPTPVEVLEEPKPVQTAALGSQEPSAGDTNVHKSRPSSPQGSKHVKKKKHKREEPEEEAKQKKAVDVFDLPPLNLSSDSDSSDEEGKKKTPEAVAVEPPPPPALEQTQPLAALPAADDRLETEEPTPVLDGIWDKFQNFQASLEKKDPIEEARALICKTIMMEHDYCLQPGQPRPSTEEGSAAGSGGDKTDPSESKEERPKSASPHAADANRTPKSSPVKKKKTSKKRKRASSGRVSSSSSSDSSSDSDSDSSSSSCGTNCSCSSHSSSSSSSSSSSDSDDSSSSEGRSRAASKRERRKEKAKEKSGKKEEETVVVDQPPSQESVTLPAAGQPPAEEPHIDVMEGELTIRESDLDTTETETDEDFYDDNPQKLANELLQEKRNLLLLAAVAPTNNGSLSPAQSHSSQPPSAAPSEATPSKKRSKKRKKKSTSSRLVEEQIISHDVTSVQQERTSDWSQYADQTYQSYTGQSNSINSNETTPTFSSSYYKSSGQGAISSSPAFNSVPSPAPFAQQQPQHLSKQSLSKFSEFSAQSTGSGSETEGRTKRKRMRNKFYGYSSGEEGGTGRHKPSKQRKSNVSSNYQSNVSHHTSTSYVSSQFETPPQPVMPPLTIKRSQIKPPAPPAPEVSYEPTLVHPLWGKNSVTQRKSDSDSDSDTKPNNGSSSSDTDSDDDAMHIAESPPAPTPQYEVPRVKEPQPNLYCYCQCPYDEVSEMIACDGENCKIEWFHFECVGIMVPPKGQWYCPDCRRRMGLGGQDFVLNS